MAQRLTPIIGLAVAAALALAAVFGFVGLTPAYAGVETPDSRGLDGKVFHAATDSQDGEITAVDATITVPVDAMVSFDMSTLFTDTTDGSGTEILSYRAIADPPADAGVADDPPNQTDEEKAAALAAAKFLLGPADAAIRNPAENRGTDGPFHIIGHRPADTSDFNVEITAKQVGTHTLPIQAFDDETSMDDAMGVLTVRVVDSFVSSSTDPGARSRFDVTFIAPTNLTAGLSEIEIEMEDYGFPGSLDRAGIGVASNAVYDSENIQQVQGVLIAGDPDAVAPANADDDTQAVGKYVAGNYRAGLQTPDSVTLSGETIKITVPDMNSETDRADHIRAGDLVTVLIRQGAGVTNPTEGGGYKAVIENNEDASSYTSNEIDIPFLVELSEEDGGRGTTVTATGKGFKNGVSLGFFLDERTVHVDNDNDPDTPASRDNGVDDNGNGEVDEEGETDGRDYRNPNGMRDSGEVKLCDVATVGSNDVGSCEFTVNNPPFVPGYNFINAVDGRGQRASETMNDDQRFELKPSITITPTEGNPGETILVQGYDFPQGQVTKVQLARQNLDALGRTNADAALAASGDGSAITGTTTVGNNGDLNFRLVIPNWAAEGVQDLRVFAGGEDDNVNVTIGGPRITATPTTVLPNQRISLVGTGFTPNSRIAQGTGGSDPSITIGGYTIPIANINEGDPVSVDNGGKWSASLDLPLRDVTTRDGNREIRVTDSGGRSGTVNVTIPARVVTIDPASGRIGTEATVRGENFPSKNDNGESFNIEIAYDSGTGRPTTVSTTSDASGRFEETIRVPTSATIPSTNTVRVSFDDEANVPVTTTVTHDVPEGTITLSASSGTPGSRITLRGEGFKTFVPVKSVRIGSIDVLPSPAPATDAQGMTEFEVLVPGLDSGIQTIEVEVSDTTASIGFTVTSAAAIGAETPVADGVANLGDNFLRAFNFNNDTKSWTFYDPEAGDASTMNFFIAKSSYWILIGQSQEVILNRETRNLTCANGNCWNLIVW